ncbi:tryptophan synthase subunit alpha [Candidatus Vidania fulgoroideae]|uniref:Tryptophan synthase subunit alpha n=1 Tax=Candidatus Vidania fulgoroideorum TaxID=881286 RepID=A0A974X7K2_9PROT|nr:tryptophan synthase subunit alpha [Candidatus Vidania fulgoroideae]
MSLSKIVFVCVPYFPNPCSFRKYICFLKEQGLRNIEICFPFSNSILDGSVIKSSYYSSLCYGDAYKSFIIGLDFIISRGFFRIFVIIPGFTLGNLKFIGSLFYRDKYIYGYIIPDINPKYNCIPYFIKPKIYQFSNCDSLISNITTKRMYISLQNITGGSIVINNKFLNYIRLITIKYKYNVIVGFGIRRISHVLYFYKHVRYVVVGSKLISFLNKDIFLAFRFIKYVKDKIKKNW